MCKGVGVLWKVEVFVIFGYSIGDVLVVDLWVWGGYGLMRI